MAEAELSLEMREDGFEIILSSGIRLSARFLDRDTARAMQPQENGLLVPICAHLDAHLYMDEGVPVIRFLRQEAGPRLVRLQMDAPIIEREGVYFCGEIQWVIVGEGAGIAENNVFSLVLLSSPASLEFSKKSDAKFSAMNYDSGTQRFLVPASCRAPEFSIALYDDAAFTRPRPLRQNVPVISTVPSPFPSAPEEVTFFNEGLGPPSRTVYFKVVCNAMQSLVLTPSLQIVLYNPFSGQQTRAVAALVPLPVAGGANTDAFGRAYFKGQYDFNVQDGVNYFDGMVFFNVSIPLTVFSPLAMSVQVARAPLVTQKRLSKTPF